MLEELDTEELIERARRGSREAFDRLAAAQSVGLAAFVRTRLSTQLAGTVGVEDLVQETLMRGFLRVGDFSWQGDGSFAGWLRGIAKHVVLEQTGKRRPRTDELRAEPSAHDPSPSTCLRRSERFQTLRRAVDRLSPDHREVILLARIDGLRIKEIAERLDRSEDAVKKLLARALGKLRESLDMSGSMLLPGMSLRGGGADRDGGEHDGEEDRSDD